MGRFRHARSAACSDHRQRSADLDRVEVLSSPAGRSGRDREGGRAAVRAAWTSLGLLLLWVLAALVTGVDAAWTAAAQAHCDTLDGPVPEHLLERVRVHPVR